MIDCHLFEPLLSLILMIECHLLKPFLSVVLMIGCHLLKPLLSIVTVIVCHLLMPLLLVLCMIGFVYARPLSLLLLILLLCIEFQFGMDGIKTIILIGIHGEKMHPIIFSISVEPRVDGWNVAEEDALIQEMNS